MSGGHEAKIGLETILSNTLVLQQLAPYLPVRALFALAATSKYIRQVLRSAPEYCRYLDLSRVKSAVLPEGPMDKGGVNWRSQRMDESLTEDDFYAGPIRGIFSKIERQRVLKNVHTLILDGLSVPADVVQEIITSDRFNVRILSIREARHLNERKLMQILRYAVRPSRPKHTPRLKGLYLFGPKDASSRIGSKTECSSRDRPDPLQESGVMSSAGAQIGATWNQKSQQALDLSLSYSDNRWYRPTERAPGRSVNPEWGQVLKECEGIIFFDAVLCRGPRHDISAITDNGTTTHLPNESWLKPAVATVALGPAGCAQCGTSCEGPAVFDASPESHLPLLSPLPLHSSRIRSAQNPCLFRLPGLPLPHLFLRCEDCVLSRRCQRCYKWWCEQCYSAPAAGKRLPEQFGVIRACVGCGPTCVQCKEVYIRTCQSCRSTFCVVDNVGCSATECDWCNHTGRRTRELY